MRVELEPLPGRSLAAVEEEWRELSSRATLCPYLTLGWLGAWMAVYDPRRLHLLRVTDPRSGPVALGLVEELPLRRLRFAGAPVTPIRGLLCSAGEERAAWRALGEWIGDGRARRTSLEGSGVDASSCDVPGAVLTPLPWLRVTLPGSFEDYLGARSPELRRNFRRKLRLAERAAASAAAIEPDGIADALAAFVRLHNTRASAKGEVHPNIDGTLASMLARVAAGGEPRLRVTAVRQGAKMVAVGLELEQGSELWFYNAGFDPEGARLSPGLVLRLASIRAAIERGLECCDLGPGDYRYKQDMGGEPVERVRVNMSRRSALGGLERLAQVSRRRARDVEWLRRGLSAGPRVLRRKTRA